MKLSARLLLLGAVLPVAVLLLAFTIGGVVFDRSLRAQIDRALMTQAAVEAVSLFDRKDSPHLHLDLSPLDSAVREFAPRGAVYGPQGELLMQYPEGAHVPESVGRRSAGDEPVLHTHVHGEHRDRVLVVRVQDPHGVPHTLWLAASLDGHDGTMRIYRRTTVLTLLVVALALVAIQFGQARQLTRRVGGLADHMRRVGEGELSGSPPEDAGADEIAELRKAIDRTTDELRRAREAQDRLVADAAHELRTPLAAMRANIDVALRRERSSEDLREVLEKSRLEVDRLADLATRLLDLAALRGGPLERRSVDLPSLLAEAGDVARGLAEERDLLLDVDVEVGGDALEPISGHAEALRQAVDNLLANAVKFSPSGGTIRLALEVDDERLRIAVEDEGPGVPERDRQSIFEPFHRADLRRGGKGLGLALVRDVAERHGGEARCESRPDGPGARFVVELYRCCVT